MATRLIADDIIAADGPPRLIGGRHRDSGRHVFPCPAGSEAASFDPVPLSADGTLWSWTVQRFRPKTPPYAGPAAFEPFAVGYVELAGETIVESRIVDVPFDALAIGMKLRLVLVPFATDADGTTVLTYAFAPIDGEQPA